MAEEVLASENKDIEVDAVAENHDAIKCEDASPDVVECRPVSTDFAIPTSEAVKEEVSEEILPEENEEMVPEEPAEIPVSPPATTDYATEPGTNVVQVCTTKMVDIDIDNDHDDAVVQTVEGVPVSSVISNETSVTDCTDAPEIEDFEEKQEEHLTMEQSTAEHSFELPSEAADVEALAAEEAEASFRESISKAEEGNILLVIF